MRIWWRGWAADKIVDLGRARDARESVERWIEARPRSPTDIDCENAMIASDIGLYAMR